MSYSGVKQTGQARQILGKALEKLQENPDTPQDVLSCAKEVAQAVGALFNAEQSKTESEGKSYVKDALNYMSQTLALLQNVSGQNEGKHLKNIEEAAQIIAQGMGTLYPLTTLPTQREFKAQDSSRDPIAQTRNSSAVDLVERKHTPTPYGETLKPKGPEYDSTQNSETRNIEVNIGVSTESNFYVGFSGNIKEGGVFYATYEPLPNQTAVDLHITLPGGLHFNAKGVVHFKREPSHFNDSATPGVGIKFVNLSDTGHQLATRFAEKKPPLFFDN